MCARGIQHTAAGRGSRIHVCTRGVHCTHAAAYMCPLEAYSIQQPVEAAAYLCALELLYKVEAYTDSGHI